MDAPYFKTGIKELDTMLGIEKNSNGKKENNNRIALIKGGPGSGKTTLGLQVLHNHLKRNKEKDKKDNTQFVACYVSLEIDPKLSSEYASSRFNFTELTDKVNYYQNSKEELKKSLENFYRPDGVHLPKLSDVIFDCLKNKEGIKLSQDNDDKLKVVFVDSLNVLIDMIRSVVDKNVNERDIIKSICDIDFNNESDKEKDDKNKNTIFVFSVEYHPTWGQSKLAISESFMCDTEILLSIEPVFGSNEKNVQNISSIGYKFEGNQEGEKKNEYRSFCRVLKTRFDNHQTRRCSYDINNGIGLQFYESFPGDGHISLFCENAKQKEAWESFFIEDIPHQFPALRHEDFERKQMQQNFSNRRRFAKVPEKTDLYLSSYDNYWIHWFTTVDQKRIIRDFIQNESRTFKKYISESKTEWEKSQRKKELEPIISFIFKTFQNDIFNLRKIKNEFTGIKFQDLKGKEVYLNLKNIAINALEYISINDIEISNVENKETKKEGKNKEDNTIDVKYKDINNVKKIYFTVINENAPQKISIKYIDVEDKKNNKGRTIYIIRNIKGTILFVTENQLVNQIIYVSYFYQKIEFEVDKSEDYLMYDARYHTIDRSQTINEVFLAAVESENNDLVPQGIVIQKEEPLDEGKFKFEESDRIVIEEIICQFVNDKMESKIQLILNNFFTSKGLRCFSCTCLNYFYFENIITDEKLKLKILEELNQKRNSDDCNLKGINIFEGDKCPWYNKKVSKEESSLSFIPDSFRTKLEELSNDRGKENIKNLINDVCNFKNYPNILQESNNQEYLCEKINADTFKSDIVEMYLRLLEHFETKSFLARINVNRLKIFGERKSNFIKELNDWDHKNNRPIHCRQSLFGFFDRDNYISIPYNANISIFVYRKDILNDFYKKLKESPNKMENYVNSVIDIYNKQRQALNVIYNYHHVFDEKRIEEIVYQSINDMYPKTWEEIFAIYKSFNHKMDLVLDIKTPDTYNCTFLELLWNCGGSFNVLADYSFDTPEETTKKHLLHAYYLLAYMFYSGILPEDSTVQPPEFSERYNDTINERDWIFGRFWYSTFVELFHAKEQDKKDTNKYLWNPTKKNELGLMPMPVTLSKYLDKDNPNEVEHCATWGDWHLGIIQGSENMQLGKDIVDHLLSSRKVIENAYNNAFIPTTEDFYKLYKNTNCFNPSKRDNIVMPNTTYKEIRYNYFRYAQSRSQIYDYRHCMVELNTILKYIENVTIRDRYTGSNIPDTLPEYIVHEINHLLDHAMDGIKGIIKLDNN
jgi:ABC-type glycerol-3-phosphate transport system substrate-binding protein